MVQVMQYEEGEVEISTCPSTIHPLTLPYILYADHNIFTGTACDMKCGKTAP